MISDLSGRWAILRRISPAGSFAGTAIFSARDDGALAYEERGEMRLASGSFRAERRYLFEPRENGFAVYFEGEPRRLFHEIALQQDEDGALRGEATHLCGDDTYVSAYRFEAPDAFSVTHRVTGPRKDYTMTTSYTRASGQTA